MKRGMEAVALTLILSAFAMAEMPAALSLTDTTHVARIELNHCYRYDHFRKTVSLAYSQVIFWRFRVEPIKDQGLTRTPRVVRFLLLEHGGPRVEIVQAARPTAVWWEDGRRRVVVGDLFEQTWTSVEDDPEIVDGRNGLSRERREILFPGCPRLRMLKEGVLK